MMLVVSTQCTENYGTPDSPYWKNKGGSDYKVLNVPTSLTIEELLEQVRDQVEYSNPYSEEYIIGCTLRPDDWLSGNEQTQLEYDGRITYPEPTMEWNDLPFLKQIDEVEKVKELNDG
jgi:hypothetical protein